MLLHADDYYDDVYPSRLSYSFSLERAKFDIPKVSIELPIAGQLAWQRSSPTHNKPNSGGIVLRACS